MAVRLHVHAIANGQGERVVRESTCIANSVTEVGRHFSFSLPQASAGLKSF